MLGHDDEVLPVQPGMIRCHRGRTRNLTNASLRPDVSVALLASVVYQSGGQPLHEVSGED